MPYSNQIIRLDFPELTDDPVNDPIRVIIRNPRLMTQGEFRMKDTGITQGPDGEAIVTDEDQAASKGNERFAKMVVGWRVYDATTPIELDDDGNVTSQPELLPMPATAETVAKLPMAIVTRLAEELKKALNPQ